MKKLKIALVVLVAILGATVIAIRLAQQTSATVSPLRYAAATDSLIVVNGLTSLGKSLEDVSKNRSVGEVLSLLGKPNPEELFATLRGQLAFDLRDDKSIREAGIDGTSPIFISGTVPHRINFLALPVDDEDKIQAWLSGRMVALGGLKRAPDKSEIVPGVWAIAFQSEPSTTPPKTSVAALKDGHLFVSPSVELLKTAFELPQDKSAESSPDVQKAMGQLPKSTVSGVYSRPTITAALGIHLDASRVDATLRLVEPWGAKSQQETSTFQELLPLFSKSSEPLSITGKLSPTAPIHLTSAIDPTEAIGALSRFFPRLTRPLNAQLKNASLSLEDIAAIFAPGAVISLAPAPSGKIVSVVSSPSQWRPTLFLSALNVEIATNLRDASNAASLLDKASHLAVVSGVRVQRYDEQGALLDNGPDAISAVISSAAAFFGFEAKIRPTEAKENTDAQATNEKKQAKRWAFQMKNGLQISAAISETQLMMTLGSPELFEALKNRPLVSRTDKLKEGTPSSARLDVDRSVDSIRAFPDSAYGIGGFAIKGALDRWLSALGGMKDVTLQLDREDDVAIANASLRLANAEGDADQQSASGSTR